MGCKSGMRLGNVPDRVVQYEQVSDIDLVQHIIKYESILTFKTATDVVQYGHPIFDDFFQHLWTYIGNNTANFVFQMVKRLWLIRIDQSLYIGPTENSLAVLNHKILEANFTGPKREIRRSPNVSFNKSIVARAV
ncbi:hypothetical protein TNCV_3186851 [Trichonephila clavipes]|nr:hypothetical protein TNCV_3186851 [Trichonephila clavipes]